MGTEVLINLCVRTTRDIYTKYDNWKDTSIDFYFYGKQLKFSGVILKLLNQDATNIKGALLHKVMFRNLPKFWNFNSNPG